MLYSNSSNSRNTTRKRKLAPLLEPAFLQALLSSSDVSTPSPTRQLGLTNGAVQALHDCQQAFVSQLTRQLKAESQCGYEEDATVEDDTKRTVHVLPRHVEDAMKALGMDDIVEEALAILHENNETAEENTSGAAALRGRAIANTTSNRRKRKKKKPLVVTAEMEAEQERLFQASRDKNVN